MPAASLSYADVIDPNQEQLRHKIAWLCHTVRAMSVASLVWQLWTMLQFWTDEKWVIYRFKVMAHVDISGISGMQRLEGFAAEMLHWCLLFGAVLNICRLFGGFVKGSIFTVAASRRLMGIGLYTGAAMIVGVLEMPVFLMIVTSHLQGSSHLPLAKYADSGDLLSLTFCVLIVALAHVFKAAAEIADEQRGFV